MKIFSEMQKRFENILETDTFKYNLVTYCITTVHIVLVILFCFLRIVPMIFFNIGSVCTYVYCIVIIKKNEPPIKVFYITYLEIIAHSLAATICIGWRFGFAQYIIGLVPFGYYMCYTLIKGKWKYITSTLLGFCAFFCFIGCHMISSYAGSIYQLEVSGTTELMVYIFNSICNFGFLLLVSLVFIMDMQIVTNKLSSQNAILDKLASIDPLTGLYNRRSMQVFLNHALESGDSFCLVMCDIDNFKRVNDTYGHDSGDIVLKDISLIIQQQVKEHGYVCRWGGEEILILSNAPLDYTCQIAENIRRGVENHIFSLQGKIVHCTLTLGIASYKAGNTVEDTIMHADNRLYYGKKNGKNRVVSPYDTP